VRAESPRFSIVAPGIGHATFKGRSADAEPFSGHAFKIDLDEAELRLVPAGDPSARRTVEQIVAPIPLWLRSMPASSTTRAVRWASRSTMDGSWRQANGGGTGVQGIPRLLVGGKVPQLKPQIAERTAVCADGHVVVLVVSSKAEATAFARFLADPPDKGGLGCWDALNLDGARQPSSW
jgi:hypothetical protein